VATTHPATCGVACDAAKRPRGFAGRPLTPVVDQDRVAAHAPATFRLPRKGGGPV